MCIKGIISVLLLYISVDFAELRQSKHYNPISLTGEIDWDLLIFTQHWPTTVCKIWTHKKPNHSCNYPKVRDVWTIHGSWPTKLGTRGPENCNSSWLFDPEQVRPIEDQLEQLWINVEKDTGLYDLWVHEWTKHGTCAASIEPLNNEFKYFNKGLEFQKQYSMTNILGETNIHPSNSQPVTIDQINQAIIHKIGKKPMIHCQYEEHIQYLFEIRICFDKNLSLTDCDPLMHLYKNVRNINGSLTNCNINAHIIYPEQDSTKSALVQAYMFIHWLQWFTL